MADLRTCYRLEPVETGLADVDDVDWSRGSRPATAAAGRRLAPAPGVPRTS
jgi:hypothetical protein